MSPVAYGASAMRRASARATTRANAPRRLASSGAGMRISAFLGAGELVQRDDRQREVVGPAHRTREVDQPIVHAATGSLPYGTLRGEILNSSPPTAIVTRTMCSASSLPASPSRPLLDACPEDPALTISELGRAGLRVMTGRGNCEAAFSHAVRAFVRDVILGDQVVMQFNGVGALGVLRAMGSAAPVIVVAGAVEAATVVAAFKAGARDVIFKSYLIGLRPAGAAAARAPPPLPGLCPPPP